MKSILQGNPFEPTDIEAIAITNVGLMFAHILILLVLIILMIYSYRNLKDILPVIVIYGFSLIIGMESLSHIHTPFSPMIEIFFLVFQSTIFLLSAMNLFQKNKTKFNVD